jgi:hypothetical protein
MGHSLPNWAIRNMSVHYPIADMRADVAGRRFGPLPDQMHRSKNRFIPTPSAAATKL